MPTRETLENVLYQQKRAHKFWLSEAVLRGETPSDEIDELVWELLISYGGVVEEFELAKEDVYKTAYELGTLALRTTTIERIIEIYRDCLVDAMMDADPKSTRDQYRTLVHFANTISTAYCEANADQLKKTIRHNRAENVSNELRIAKSIQSHLLPKVIPVIPGFEFAGRLVPAEEVGGDYWSVKHYKDDGRVTMKLADISGHGVAAATLVAAVKFISGGYYRGSESAADVIFQTNRVLTKETPHDILVTMVYGWLLPATYELSVVNAGHAPVFLCSRKVCTDVPPTGPVLGVTESARYGEQTFKLARNDIVFFGSDGITEAGIGEPFGVERLKALVSDNSHLAADQIADKIVEAVVEYARQPHDDISLLIVKVTGEPPKR